MKKAISIIVVLLILWANNQVLAQDTTLVFDNFAIEMVKVEGGQFTMGSNDGHTNEAPTHNVTLTTYYIGKYEVTQGLWKAVMGSNPKVFTGDHLPILNISWVECLDFIAKLNQLTKKKFALPSEAQWEFAAKGGNKSKGYTYSGSNNLSEVGWYTDNADYKVQQGGRLSPNELGIYDMSGNVNEWCADEAFRIYTSDNQTNPVGKQTSQVSRNYRVKRGGCVANFRPAGCSNTNRLSGTPNTSSNYEGFRIILAE